MSYLILPSPSPLHLFSFLFPLLSCVYARDGICDDPRGVNYCQIGTDCAVRFCATEQCLVESSRREYGGKYRMLVSSSPDKTKQRITRLTNTSHSAYLSISPVRQHCLNLPLSSTLLLSFSSPLPFSILFSISSQDCGPVGADNFTRADDDGWWDDDDDYWTFNDGSFLGTTRSGLLSGSYDPIHMCSHPSSF